MAKPAVESTLVGAAPGGKPAARKRGDTPVAPVSATAAKPEPAIRTVETRVEVRKGGFMPTFLGGVVAAGLGAAACYWAIPHLPPALRPGAVEAVSPEEQLDAARNAGTEAARAEIQTQAQALGDRAADAGADAARQALADSAPVPATPSPEVNDKLAALERAVADLGARAVPAATDQQAAAPAPASGPSQAALDELAARLNQQQARIDELAARPAVDPATAQQVQALADQAAQLQQSTQDANRRAQAATAAAALQAAIEGGAPRDQALADLSGAGVEVPQVLTGDIPRLDQLRAEFPAAARDGLRAALESRPAEGGVMTAVGDFLRVQTGARSVEPRQGDDPDAILSRADAAVQQGNIAGALTEIATLPQPAQQAMASWTARAQVWTDANAALSALASGSR